MSVDPADIHLDNSGSEKEFVIKKENDDLVNPFLGSKCGEIHLTLMDNEDWSYGIVCSYCKEKIMDIDTFCGHVVDFHLELKEFLPTKIEDKTNQAVTNNDCKNEYLDRNDDTEFSDIENVDIIKEDEPLINIKNKIKKESNENFICELFNTDVETKMNSMKSQIECFRSSKLQKHLIHNKSLAKKKLSCKICGLKFNELEAYKVHRELAHNNFPCCICKKVFYSTKNLKAHLITHDENRERKFKCNQCEASYFTRHSLTKHIKIIHLNLKNVSCNYCDKRFYRNSDKEIHERTHTGERPYICELCGSTFKTTNMLTSHKKRHNNEKNYVCKLCNKKFFTHTYLRDHMVSHTKEKPHKCDLCDARFTLRSGLHKHKQLHSDVKRYICGICGKAYAQNPGLYAHMKSHKISKELKQNITQ